MAAIRASICCSFVAMLLVKTNTPIAKNARTTNMKISLFRTRPVAASCTKGLSRRWWGSHGQNRASGVAENLMIDHPREMCGNAGMGGMVRPHHNQIRTLVFSLVQDSFGRRADFDDEFHRDANIARNQLLKSFQHAVTLSLGGSRSSIAGHLGNMQHGQLGVLVLRQPK